MIENGVRLDVPPAVLERICNGTHEAYDKLIVRTMLKLANTAHVCYEYEFRATQSSEEKFEERKRFFETDILDMEETLIEILKKVEWDLDSAKHTYEFVDVVPHPDFEVCLGSASVRFGPYLKP